jgi:hypothetical protein
LEGPLVQLVGQFYEDGLIRMVWVDRVCFEKPALDRGERDSADDGFLLGVTDFHRGDDRRKRRDGLVQEDVLGCETKLGLSGAGYHLDAEDGVAAEFEEVVVDSDLFHAEYVCPDVG